MGDDFALEHWIPQWFNRELFPARASGGVRHDLYGQVWEADRFELTVEHVCRTCNNGWLSRLESRCKPHVLPLLLGQAGPKHQHEWRIVATWCYLKLISLELSRPDEHVRTHQPSAYATFKSAEAPPYPNCSLAVGYHEIVERSLPSFIWWESSGHHIHATPTTPGADGYHTTLVIGHLVVDVYGIHAAANLNVKRGIRDSMSYGRLSSRVARSLGLRRRASTSSTANSRR